MKKLLLTLFTLITLQIQAQCWKQVAGGYSYKIGIKDDGTLWAWGTNEKGQFGNGTTQGSYVPVQIGTDSDWKFVDAGGNHTIAQKNDGSIWTWGYNEYGQLGNGTTDDSWVPVQVGADNDWIIVDAGGLYNFAIKSDGTLWGWGYNGASNLGDGTSTNKLTPVQIGTDTWKTVAGGSVHSAGIKTDGTFFAWGNAALGQLGNGVNNGIYSTPTQISPDAVFEKVYCGMEITGVIKTDGTFWGAGHFFGSSLAPRGGNNFKEAAISGATVVAVKNNGTLWAMGENNAGQLGNGTTNNSNSFYQVGTDTDWQLPIAGGPSSGGLKSSGELFCWGANSLGQSGIGNTEVMLSPMAVECPVAALNDNTLASISLYPNPTSSTLTLANPENLNIESLMVTDMTGKVVLSQNNNNNTQVNVEKLPAGIYFLKVSAAEGVQNLKFIKE